MVTPGNVKFELLEKFTVIKIEKTKRKMHKAKQQLKTFQLCGHTMGFIHVFRSMDSKVRAVFYILII